MPNCKSCKDTKKIRLLFSEVDCLDCQPKYQQPQPLLQEIVWNLEDAVDLLRQIEQKIKPIKYTSALGGGVLFKGSSRKDLDIFLAPYNKTDANYDALVYVLESMGFVRKKTKDEVHKGFEYAGDGDKEHKHVEIWDYNGKRVDFFFVE